MRRGTGNVARKQLWPTAYYVPGFNIQPKSHVLLLLPWFEHLEMILTYWHHYNAQLFRCSNDNVANRLDIYLIQLNWSESHYFITIWSSRLDVIQEIPAQLPRRKNRIAGYSLEAMCLPSKDGKCNLCSRDTLWKGNSLQLVSYNQK